MHPPLLTRLHDRSARIGIVGMGYVGLPLALRFAEVGYSVLGFDVDGSKIEALNAGRSYIGHISQQSVATAPRAPMHLLFACPRHSSVIASPTCPS